MDYKENPPASFKDQCFLEDLVKQYLEMVGLRQLAEKEIDKLEELDYNFQISLTKNTLQNSIQQATETIQQINWLLATPKKY